jgi:hypothetical protein
LIDKKAYLQSYHKDTVKSFYIKETISFSIQFLLCALCGKIRYLRTIGRDRIIMKYTNSRFQQRTTSSDLMLSFGLSIFLHVLIIVVDPLVSINMDNRWKDQLQGSIMVYLQEGVEGGDTNGAHLSNPPAVKKGSPPEGEKIRKKKTIAQKPARHIKPADKPVLVSKIRRADSPSVPQVRKYAPPPDAPAPKAEAPRNAGEVSPAPVEKKVVIPDLPPKVSPPEPEVEPAPKMAVKESPTPVERVDPAEPLSTDAPKPAAVPIKPIEQPRGMDEVQALTTLPKKGKPQEENAEQIMRPAPQVVKETVKTEPMPTEVRQEAPVTPEPVKVEERPVEPPVVPEPVKVEERPVEPPVAPEPVKVEERPVEAAVQKIIEPVQPEVPPPAPVEVAPAAPEEKREAPVTRDLAKADEQPVVLPKPQSALSDRSSPGTTEKAEKETPLPKQVPETLPVTAGPSVVNRDEKLRSESVAPKESVLPAKGQPIKPAAVIDKTVVKVAEAPTTVAEPKAGAPVKRKMITLSMLKRLESETEPMGIGIPISRPRIKITTPGVKNVKNRVQNISGQVKGNGITRVILSLNEDSVTVPVEHETFHWEGALKDGKNTIIATAWDRNRYSAADKVIVETVPAKNAFSLSIDEPGSGEVESPVVTVKGKVGDSTVDSVKLILNKETIEVAVLDGGFEKTVLFSERENSLQAEAVNAAGASARSELLNVAVKNKKSPDILVHLIWNDPGSELKAIVARKDREGLDQDSGAVSTIDAIEKMSAREGYREKIFAVYEAKAGAHIISVAGGKKTRCLVIVTVPAKQKTRLFGPMLIEEEGTIIGRLLMPQGVYWDEDEWFTGKIENGDTVTKYNSPEGMSWKEMK